MAKFWLFVLSSMVLSPAVLGDDSDQSLDPSNAWGDLKSDQDYEDQGTVNHVDDLDIYVVGQGPRAILWHHDISGFDAGRTRQLADGIAARGYLVLLPNFYYDGQYVRGQTNIVEFIQNYTSWSKMKEVYDNKVFPLARELGATSFGAIGTCWGSYPVVRLTGSYPEVTAGVSMHPSHPNMVNALGEKEEDILNEVLPGARHLFLPAGGDPDSVKPGGLGSRILGDRLEILEFPEMRHGWTTRGDISQPNVDRDVKKALSKALEFFDKHV